MKQHISEVNKSVILELTNPSGRVHTYALYIL